MIRLNDTKVQVNDAYRLIMFFEMVVSVLSGAFAIALYTLARRLRALERDMSDAMAVIRVLRHRAMEEQK